MTKRKASRTSRNATREISPEEARKKREHLLEQARKEAEERGQTSDAEHPEDASLATFILPGD